MSFRVWGPGMRRIVAVGNVLFLLLVGTFAFGKANTSRITVQGDTLTSPIEITDARVLAQYRVWSGPQTSSNEQQSLIVDWTKPVSEPPPKLRRYDVCFYINEGTTSRLVYSVTYAYDSASGSGYVYIPGRSDSRWKLNVRTIWHGTEGTWFRSWSAWDATAAPLLQRASQR